MNRKLKNLLAPGMTVLYEYDFGDTTELLLTVNSCRTGKSKEEKITLLSRNNPPKILCSQCGEREAKWINPGVYYGVGLWCEECLRGGREDDGEELDEEFEDEEFEDEYYLEDYFLPVCNSPRMGICAYEGSNKYPDQFVPDKK